MASWNRNLEYLYQKDINQMDRWAHIILIILGMVENLHEFCKG
jgi:hypothetical protein